MKKTVWILTVLVAAAAVTLAVASRRQPITVAASAPQKANFIAAAGRVEPDGEEVKIGAEMDGKLDRVAIDEGDEVRRGQVLAVVRNGEFLARVDLAKTSLRERDAQLERLRNDARLEEKREAEAQCSMARSERDRRQNLLDRGAISRSEFDSVARDVETSRARIHAMGERLSVVRTQTRPEDLKRAGQWMEEASTISERTRLAVIDVYLQALAPDARPRAAASRIETAAAALQQARDAEQAGTSSKLDVARALQRFETEQATLVLARRDRDSLITTLKRTIGLDQAAAVELDEFRATPADPAVSARSEMRALVEEARAAERERWPKLQALGDFKVLGHDPANSVSAYAVGASVNIPLWTRAAESRMRSRPQGCACRSGQRRSVRWIWQSRRECHRRRSSATRRKRRSPSPRGPPPRLVRLWNSPVSAMAPA